MKHMTAHDATERHDFKNIGERTTKNLKRKSGRWLSESKPGRVFLLTELLLIQHASVSKVTGSIQTYSDWVHLLNAVH